MAVTNTSISLDPYQVLDLPNSASEAEIRERYLQLVKQFPPERDPDKFREVRAAFEAAQDPLVIARRLLEPPAEEPARWADALEAQRKMPPPLDPELLLSLGNCVGSFPQEAAEAAGDTVPEQEQP